MDSNIVVALAEHRVLGYIFSLIEVSPSGNKDYYGIVSRVTSEDMAKNPAAYSPDLQALAKAIDEYSETSLVKVFSKKKVSVKDFFAQPDEKLVTEQIRPYVERRMTRCIEIINRSGMPLYFKSGAKHLYTSDQIEVSLAPASSCFYFIRSGEGCKYQLRVEYLDNEIKLLNKPAIVLCHEPCRLILDNKLLSFSDIDSKKLLPFFKHEFIQIPASRENEYFEKFVRNIVRQYKVVASGFEVRNVEPAFESILSLESDLSGDPVLVLKFRYPRDKNFFALTSTETTVDLETTGGSYIFHRLTRDAGKEQEVVDKLIQMGLLNNRGPHFYIPGYQHLLFEDRLPDLVNWLNLNEKPLRNANIQLTQEYFNKQYYLSRIELSLNIDHGRDWFDVHAIVQLGEFKIPFSMLRRNILQGNREYILPNGQIAILPKEWFAKYSDLFFFAEKDTIEGKMRLKNHFFSIVNVLEPEDAVQFKSIYDRSTQGLALNGIKVPGELKAELRPYQVEGFSWLCHLHEHGFGGCLADDMGLGKTLQTLAMLLHVTRLEESRANGSGVPASLIVLPASLVHNWYNEIRRFAPTLSVYRYTGTNRDTGLGALDRHDIVLTTYGIIRNEQDDFCEHEFLYLILDESQVVKNPESKIYQAILRLRSRYKLVLTGTPIENTLTDLWSQMNFLNHGLLGNQVFFRKRFVTPIEKEGDEAAQARLQTLVHPFILRRNKQEVAKDLPELIQQVRYCSMTEIQKSLYETEKSVIRNDILQNIAREGLEKTALMVLQSLTRLRQIANHPLLVNQTEVNESGKYEAVINSLEDILQEKNKVLIFSSFVKHLELFREYLENRQVPYAYLTGRTKDREAEVRKFQEDASTRVFLISLKAGGVGLNLTAADYVFLLDPWWNPAAEMQAISRAHRIGQTNTVFVYRFITAETIEEKILDLQDKKSALADLFVNSNNPFRALSMENIQELFG